MADFERFNYLLKDGEYAERKKILSGLTLEQVTKTSLPYPHTIYDELWHAAKWQNIVVNNDQALYQKWQTDEHFPNTGPKSQQDWDELVNEFLAGLDKAIEVSKSKEKMGIELASGFTIEDSFYALSIHNAYHLSKIVAIRQMIGTWPPKEI
jgi:hypothetical protein